MRLIPSNVQLVAESRETAFVCGWGEEGVEVCEADGMRCKTARSHQRQAIRQAIQRVGWAIQTPQNTQVGERDCNCSGIGGGRSTSSVQLSFEREGWDSSHCGGGGGGGGGAEAGSELEARRLGARGGRDEGQGGRGKGREGRREGRVKGTIGGQLEPFGGRGRR